MSEWGQPSIFCERHKGRTDIRRCAHLGNRFVAWVQLDDWLMPDRWNAFVDFVEDVCGGNVIVEPGYAETFDGAMQLWNEQVAKMQRGEPPNPELG